MRGELPGSPKPLPGSGSGSGAGAHAAKKTVTVDTAGELQLLRDKEHTCPVCGYEFTTKIVRAGKAQSDGMDMDLRPRFKNIDVAKYRVTECPVCGYADMDSYFGKIRPKEAALLKEKATRWDKNASKEEKSRRYEDAYTYYKSAMRCCLIRGAKSGLRGYTALNTAWLLRGWRESLIAAGAEVADDDEMSEAAEHKLIKYAMRNLEAAAMGESFPICGIDETAFDYLMAALCYDQGILDDAGKYVLRALQNRSISSVLRPKAEDLRDLIKEKRGRYS